MYDLVLEIMKDYKNIRISERTIKSWHKKMFKNTNQWFKFPLETQKKLPKPGNYKKYENMIRTLSGRTKHFASPENVPGFMDSLVFTLKLEINENQKVTKILSGTHHYFCNIHPFQDGNGRVCRLLLLLITLKMGKKPFIVFNSMKKSLLRNN